LEAAATTAVKARTINNGQSCIAAKRFIVHSKIYDEFEKRFVEAMKQLRVGNPIDEETDIGPLATEQILRDLEEQVQISVAAGAKILTGGRKFKADGDLAKGNFYEPTVLVDIPKGTPAYQDEIFGPVASLFRVANLDEAIELANATPFGLGAAAWTTDAVERDRFINEIEAGSVFINGMVASDPRLPFGGVKDSGYGRELGEFGIREFVNIKTVWIK
jgi:succinate-semialdehyde dehydrogenase/glutarate-semialdehyde dehydrogenase